MIRLHAIDLKFGSFTLIIIRLDRQKQNCFTLRTCPLGALCLQHGSWKPSIFAQEQFGLILVCCIASRDLPQVPVDAPVVNGCANMHAWQVLSRQWILEMGV